MKVHNVGFDSLFNEAPSPLRSDIWSYDPVSRSYGTEASTLRDIQLDPWNRPLPHKSEWTQKINARENEVMSWHATTTIRGQKVPLVIFND